MTVNTGASSQHKTSTQPEKVVISNANNDVPHRVTSVRYDIGNTVATISFVVLLIAVAVVLYAYYQTVSYWQVVGERNEYENKYNNLLRFLTPVETSVESRHIPRTDTNETASEKDRINKINMAVRLYESLGYYRPRHG